MPNKARSQVRRDMDLIQRLMDKNNLDDDEIIRQLGISKRTLQRYQKRIRKEYAKAYLQLNKDNAQYAHARFSNTLDYCIRETRKIIMDNNTRAADRIEAIKTLDILTALYSKLERDGAVFKPELPKVITIEPSKENSI